MPRFPDIVTNQVGTPLPGAFVTVRNSPSGTLASITADNGTALPNPLTADGSGAYYFNAPVGLYSLEFRLISFEPARKTRVIDLDTDTTALAVGLFVNSATFNIPLGVVLLQTSGYSAVDKGSGVYVFDAAVNSAYVAANPLSSFLYSDGRGFRLSLEQDITPEMYGSLGLTDDSAAFTGLFGGTSFLAPAGSYALAANATLTDKGFTWHMDPGASFSGSGNILTPGMPGFDYTPNLKNILIAVKRGSVASPRTDGDAVSLAHKTSNVGDLAGAPNPAHAALHDHYGTAANSRSQAYYGEVVARAGGAAAFVEAARFHGIVPTGITCKAYGGLFYAQNGGTGINCIGNEAEVRRTVASDGAVGRAWVSSGQFDGCYNATANTANATVGGVGGKPNFGFTINPFNTIAVQTGYLVPKSVVSGKTVNDAAFQCLEVGLNYGLDLAKGGYTIAIALPNNTPVTAFNAAGSAELEAWRVDTSNVLQLGAGTSGVNSPSLKIGGTTVIDGSRNSTPASVASAGSITSASASAGVGYATGAGGTVTQLTSKATAVALNKVCGSITMNAAALAANTIVSFALTNSSIGVDDDVRVWVKSGNASVGSYRVATEGNASGSRTIVVENKTAGSLSEAIVLGFNVLKSVAA